jgi:hypothetical protein
MDNVQKNAVAAIKALDHFVDLRAQIIEIGSVEAQTFPAALSGS